MLSKDIQVIVATEGVKLFIKKSYSTEYEKPGNIYMSADTSLAATFLLLDTVSYLLNTSNKEVPNLKPLLELIFELIFELFFKLISVFIS
ncbi:19327_t:CDS:2 [Cetraspora pellucida]|uniref:19327_t:CDS:1 n=1 Tax=Cetraspora pellucida TaxID=1433469 RepID=A0A9N9F7D9_9GLOM|nr:19327_t:CDS:2 [Cetraspora pellucida]